MSDYRTPKKGWGGKHSEQIYNDLLDWLEESGREPLPGMHWDGWKQNLVVPIPGHSHTNLQVYIGTSGSSSFPRGISVNLVIESGFGSELAAYIYDQSDRIEAETSCHFVRPGTFSRFNWWLGLHLHEGNTLDSTERRKLFEPVYSELTKLGAAARSALDEYQGALPSADEARELYTADRLRRLLDLLESVAAKSPSSPSEIRSYVSSEAKRLDKLELASDVQSHTHPMHYGVFEPHSIQAKTGEFRSAVLEAVKGDSSALEEIIETAFGSVVDAQHRERIAELLQVLSQRQDAESRDQEVNNEWGITHADVLAARDRYEQGAADRYSRAQSWDVWVDDQPYSPKAILSLAVEAKTGAPLSVRRFQTYDANTVLRAVGFVALERTRDDAPKGLFPQPPRLDYGRTRLGYLLVYLSEAARLGPKDVAEVRAKMRDVTRNLVAYAMGAGLRGHNPTNYSESYTRRQTGIKTASFYGLVLQALNGNQEPLRQLINRAYADQAPAYSTLTEEVLSLFNLEDAEATSPTQVRHARDSYPTDVQQLIQALDHKPQIILYGAPGTGKTRVARRAAYALLQGDPAQIDTDKQVEAYLNAQPYELIVFHPAYDYDQFIGGLRVELSDSGQPNYRQVPGVFTRLCELARSQPDQPHVLVIDEINRGNLPKLLGELIYALEYRDSEVVFSFDGKPRTVPSNLYVMGTMNTADRSVGSLDAAIRRRFAFLRVDPNPNVVGSEPLRMLMTTINARLAELAERMPELNDLQVGHSYFLGCTPKAFMQRWTLEVLPLLEDYHRLTGEPMILADLCIDYWPDLLPEDYVFELDAVAEPSDAQQSADKLAGGGSLKMERRRSFWTQLLDYAQDRTPLFHGISPTDYHWVSKSTGLSGVSWNLYTRKNNTGCELWIDHGDQEVNDRIFAAVAMRREELESAVARECVWTNDSARRTCSVKIPVEHGGWADPESWESAIVDMIDSLIQLEAVLGPVLLELGLEDPNLVIKKASEKSWNAERFQEAIAQKLDEPDVEVMNDLFAWAKAHKLRRWWGSGKDDGSCFFQADTDGAGRHTFAVWTYGRIELQFQHYRNHPAYASDEDLHTLRNQLNTVPGVNLDKTVITRRPSLELSVLRDPAVRSQFLQVWDQFLETVGFTQ